MATRESSWLHWALRWRSVGVFRALERAYRLVIIVTVYKPYLHGLLSLHPFSYYLAILSVERDL